MSFSEIYAFMDEGLSKILSMVVIYAVLQIIRKGPTWITRLVIATENSTSAITINSALIQSTEQMHREMDVKIEDIKLEMEHIKDELRKSGLTDEQILEAISSLETKIDRLGKSQDSERM